MSDQSAKVTRLIEDLKPQFSEYVETYQVLGQRKADFAPRFNKAYEAWHGENEKGKLIDFLRVVDNTIPADRKAYKHHPAYTAAIYLRKKERVKKTIRGPLPLTAGEVLVRCFAAMARIVSEQTLVSALRKECHWPDSAVLRLAARITDAKPLVELRQPRIRSRNAVQKVA